jgi:hypothetical protein
MMIIDHRLLDPEDNSSDRDDSRRHSPSPIGSSFTAENGYIRSRTPQGPFPFNSGPPPTEPAQPGTPVSGPTVNPADTSSSSPPASPATLTNASPIGDSSTKVSAIQTVQSYLNHEVEAIRSHLTADLPGLIRGEVRTQCTQLAQEIGAQIQSIREELIRPTGDQDDPMLPSSEDGENGDSRGRGKRSARCRRDKGKGKGKGKGTESDNEVEEIQRHLHHSQESNNGDEADEEDEGGENESEEEISVTVGTREHKKKIYVFRVSIHSFSP